MSIKSGVNSAFDAYVNDDVLVAKFDELWKEIIDKWTPLTEMTLKSTNQLPWLR